MSPQEFGNRQVLLQAQQRLVKFRHLVILRPR
jgi:hypothetical protein